MLDTSTIQRSGWPLDLSNTKIRFDKLRMRVMQAICKEIEKGEKKPREHEGRFEWISIHPDVFDDPEGKEAPDAFALRLYCTLLGDKEEHEWVGATRSDVLQKAEDELNQLIQLK